MFHVIFGRAATGKTYTVMQKIKEDVLAGKKVVLLVPEQFSFESERAVLDLLGDKAGSLVQVISFSSLSDELLCTAGGIARRALTVADKIVMMRKTLETLADALPLWQKYIHSPRFAAKLADVVGEFKTGAVSAEDLERTADSLDDGVLKTKLSAIAMVYRAYDALLGSRLIDPADKLTVLSRQLRDYPWFNGKSVYIDGFKGFSGQQYCVIEQILETAAEVTVSVVCDELFGDKLNIFYNTRATLSRLRALAEKHGIRQDKPLLLSGSHYTNDTMRAVEEILSGNRRTAFQKETCAIGFCNAVTAADEVAFAARKIRSLVRENGYRYRDFVLIARDTSIYESAVKREFAACGISYFSDKRVPLVISPLYQLTDAAICAVNGYKTDEIFRYLKTGLVGGISTEEISLLENYTFLWNVRGKMWLNDWDMNPGGFTERVDDEKMAGQLEQVNAIRRKVMLPLMSFRNTFCDTVREMATAVVNLLKEIGAGEQLRQFLLDLPQGITPDDADALRQSYEKLMGVLSGIVRCFGDDPCDDENFKNMLGTASEMTDIGRIPQMLDEVTFGDAERIRPSKPKVAILLGANQGVFPAFPEQSGILGNKDREVLRTSGLDIRTRTVSYSIDENLLVYGSVCCPSDAVYLCYNNHCSDGKEKEPSAFVSELSSLFPAALTVNEPSDNLCQSNFPETEKAAFNMLCAVSGGKFSGTATLKEAVMSSPVYGEKYRHAESLSKGKSFMLSKRTAQELYGKKVHLSATGFDVYHRCHFAYFCRAGLSAKTPYAPELNVLQRGTMVHYVLEQFCNRHLADIATVGIEQINKDTDEFVEKYFAAIPGSETLMTPRFRFLVRKIKEGIADVLARMVSEFAQSKFVPERCEVQIGRDGVIPPVDFSFSGGKMSLEGSIDRLDTWGSYVRIVDYKTGTKTFRLSDTLYGQNMQMLLYLYAVVRGKNPEYCGKTPAGILYMPSKQDLNKEEIAMNGMIEKDRTVIEAMEPGNEGRFIPKFYDVDRGEKVPPSANGSFLDAGGFEVIFNYIEKLVKEMGDELLSGEINADPLDSSSDANEDGACHYCDFRSICGIEDRPHRKIERMKTGDIIAQMKGDGGNEA